MEQTAGEDNLDGAAQGALFRIEGPDDDGCVWICSAEGREVWCQNLGPAPAAATAMASWLGSVDFGDAIPDLGAF